MSDRLDDIFSLDKLRRAWKGTTEKEHGAPTEGEEQKRDASAVDAAYRRLIETIEKDFSPDCREAMAPLLVELEELLKERFSAEASGDMLGADRIKAAMALDVLLNRIEDLLEAFAIGSAR